MGYGGRSPAFARHNHLLDNALKYTDRGGRLILGLDRQNGTVRLRVENTCPRMEDDVLNRLFEPFFRGEGTGNRTGSGAWADAGSENCLLPQGQRVGGTHGNRFENQRRSARGRGRNLRLKPFFRILCGRISLFSE